MGGLYIHVPFCLKKCGYCDFYSVVAEADIRDRYAAMIERMLETLPLGRRTFDTVYFGGGTPSLLGSRAIAGILEAAARFHETLPGERTLECNPETADERFFQEAAAAGINRVSIGLQTAQEGQLRFLGRTHTRDDVRRAADAARRVGIRQISLDIMLALPGQTEEALRETIDFCKGLGVPHVSAYLLKIEPGTRFDKTNVAALCPDEDAQARLYLYAAERLEEAGLAQYEISSFARPGSESRHNLNYWTLGEYIGLGPAAHSFVGGERFFFPRNLKSMLDGGDPWSLWESDGAGGDLMEYVMLRLRLREGFDVREARARYGFDGAACLERAAPLAAAGYVRREGSRLSLTPRGFLLSNSVITALLDGA